MLPVLCVIARGRAQQCAAACPANAKSLVRSVVYKRVEFSGRAVVGAFFFVGSPPQLLSAAREKNLNDRKRRARVSPHEPSTMSDIGLNGTGGRKKEFRRGF